MLVEWHSRRILACNVAVERLFGYTPAELTGQTTRLLHATEKQCHQFGEDSEIHMAVGPNIYRGHLWMQRRDGTLLPTEDLVQLIRDETGHPYAGLSLVRDLTGIRSDGNQLKDFQNVDAVTLMEHLPGTVFQWMRMPDGEIRYPFVAGDLGERLGLEPARIRADPDAPLQLLELADLRILLHEIEHSHQQLVPMDLEHVLANL